MKNKGFGWEGELKVPETKEPSNNTLIEIGKIYVNEPLNKGSRNEPHTLGLCLASG